MYQPITEQNNPINLHQIVESNNIAQLSLAIEQTTAIDSENANGLTALHRACELGFTKCCQLLLAKGANPALKTPAGQTALHLAISGGHTDIVNILLNISTKIVIDLIDKVDMNGRSALHLTGIYGHETIMQRLIELKADINATNEHGYTPLHFAARAGHLPIVKRLIEHKAFITSLTTDNETPQLVAERYQQFEVAAYLKAVASYTPDLTVSFDAYQQLMLLELYYKLQQQDKAELLSKSLLETDGNNGWYHYYFAQLQQALGYEETAKSAYQTALGCLASPQVYCGYASLFYKQGNYASALAHSLNAFNLTSDKALIYLSTLQQAIFESITNTDFTLPVDKPMRLAALAFYLIFKSYYALGQTDQAQQQLNIFAQTINLTETSVEAEMVGHCYMILDNYLEAAYYYEQALRCQPYNEAIELHLLTCIAHFSEKNTANRPLISREYIQQSSLADHAYQQQQADKVIEYAKLARTMAIQLNAIPAQMHCLKQIADGYKWLGQFEVAAKYYVAAHKLYKQYQHQYSSISAKRSLQNDPHGLFSVAKVATIEDGQLEKQLQELEQHFVLQVSTKSKRAIKTTDSQKNIGFYRDRLHALRSTVQNELNKRQQEVCTILADFTLNVKNLIALLVQDCIALLGKPPCDFTLLALGSMGREEMNPYSDFEYAILIEKDGEQYSTYFWQLTQLLELKIIGLGETPLDKGDPLIRPGLCLDDGGSTPQGSKDIYNLIGTCKQLARLQTPEYFQNTTFSILATALQTVGFITGSHKLFEHYLKKLTKYLNVKFEKNESTFATVREQQALIFFQETLTGMYEPRLDRDEVEKPVFNIKIKLYRLVNHIIAGLALYYNITEQNSIKRLQALHDKKLLNFSAKANLANALNAIMRLRAQAHLYYGYEKEDVLSKKVDNKQFAEAGNYLLLNSQDTESILEIYKTLLPLYRTAKSFYENKERADYFKNALLYDNDLSTQGKMFEKLLQFGKAFQCYQAQLVILPSSAEAHNDMGRILELSGLPKKAEEHFNQAVILAKSDNTCTAKRKADYLIDHGRVLIGMSQFTQAFVCLTEALAIYEQQQQDNPEDQQNLISCITQLGKIYAFQGQYLQAKETYLRAINLFEQYQVAKNQDTTIQLWLNLSYVSRKIGDLVQAKNYAELALQHNLQTHGVNHPLQATCLNYLGLVYVAQNPTPFFNPMWEANRLFVEAFNIDKQVYGFGDHPALARDLKNWGLAQLKLGNDFATVKKLAFDLALDTLIKVYGKQHIEVAELYYVMGTVNEFNACTYLPEAIAIYESIYPEQPHPQTGYCYENLGYAWQKMLSLDNAKRCFKRALKEFAVAPHETFAMAALNLQLGLIAEQEFDRKEAITYFEESIKLYKSLLADAHPAVTEAGILQIEEKIKQLQTYFIDSQTSYNATTLASEPIITAQSPWSELHSQARWNDEAFDQLLQSPEKLEAKEPDWLGQTLLHAAASTGDKKRVTRLIAAGANVNICDNNGNTPLHEAASQNQQEILELLLKANAQVNPLNNYFETALYIAVKSGHLKCVQQLLKAPGILLNTLTNSGWTPLYGAAYLGHAEITEELIKAKVDINYKGSPENAVMFNGFKIYNANAAIHAAASNGHVAVVSIFIRYQADLTIIDQYGNSPLHLAARNGHLAVINVLLKAGVNPCICNTLDNSSVLLAAIDSKRVDIIQCLLSTSIDINQPDISGFAPLHRASIEGAVEIVQLLLEKGANLKIKGGDGKMPIHHAAQYGHTNIIEQFLIVDSNLHEVTDNWSNTPLHIAAGAGQVQAINLLIANHANIEARMSSSSATPLHLAASAGHESAVKTLLELGADIHATNADNNTALQLAISGGHANVASFIREKLAQDKSAQTLGQTDYVSQYNAANAKSIDECYGMFIANYNMAKELFALKEAVSQVNTANSFAKSMHEYQGWSKLHQAVACKDEKELKRLLKQNAQIAAPKRGLDGVGIGALHVAVYEKNYSALELLLNQGADASDRMLNNWQPLHWAAYYNLADMAKLLIDRQANVNGRIEMGWTPLHIAAAMGSLEVLQLLLAKGADKNVKDKFGATPIFFSLLRQHAAITTELLAANVDVRIRAKDQTSLLIVSAKIGDTNALKPLLQKAPELLNCFDNEQMTPLHYAVNASHKAAVEVLLEAGADPNIAHKLMGTALHMALRKKDMIIMQLLLKKGANCKAKDQFGNAAIHVIASPGLEEIVNPFLQFICDHQAGLLDDTNNMGMTALHVAAEQGNLYAVQQLLAFRAEVNIQDQYYRRTPLLCASAALASASSPLVNERYQFIIETLLKHQADPNLSTLNDEVPLHYFAANDRVDLIELLFQTYPKLELNKKNKSGQTSLHLAAYRNASRAIKYLINIGANINIADNNGLNPVDYAKANHANEEDLKLLTAVPVLPEAQVSDNCNDNNPTESLPIQQLSIEDKIIPDPIEQKTASDLKNIDKHAFFKKKNLHPSDIQPLEFNVNLSGKVLKLELILTDSALAETYKLQLERLKENVVKTLNKWKYKDILVTDMGLTINAMTPTLAEQCKQDLSKLNLGITLIENDSLRLDHKVF